MSERQIVKYVIVNQMFKDANWDGLSLVDQVNAKIKEGWQPYGAPQNDEVACWQPMVCYAEPGPEAAEERAKIVAWLMNEESDYRSTKYAGFVEIIRKEIEAGEHLK